MLRDEIALVDVRIAELLVRLESGGETCDAWKKIADQWDEYERRERMSDEPIERIGELVQLGVLGWAAWREITQLLFVRRRLVESERKRHVEMNSIISHEQFRFTLGALTEVVVEAVEDRRTLSTILEGFDRIFAGYGAAQSPRVGHRKTAAERDIGAPDTEPRHTEEDLEPAQIAAAGA